MNEAVPPFFGTPVLVRTGLNTGFTSIDVDAQVTTPDGSKFDVIFVGTSTGQLLKAVNSLSPKSRISTRTVIIEEIEVISSSIKSVTVINTKKGKGHVLVTAAEEIKSFPLYRCEKAKSCNDCVALQDPYCAWDVREQRCEGAQSWAKGSQAAFLQSIPTGRHSSCPGGDALPTVPTSKDQLKMGTVINQVDQQLSKSEKKEQRKEGTSNVQVDHPTVEASCFCWDYCCIGCRV
jgi:semaphorin 6